MSNLEKALALVDLGMFVIPVTTEKDGTKRPLTQNGHLDATNDKKVVEEWFGSEYKDALVGVHMGRSGLIVLDRDLKTDDKGEVTKDGFESLEANWLFPDETFHYPSISGLGRHDIYEAPRNLVISKKENYRGMVGVDRWAGSAWLLWAGDVPKSRDEIKPAPEWLCDVSTIRTGNEFEGSVGEWIDELVPGEPNALVRRAIDRLPDDDLTHGEMVSLQHHAIRLGAEGNSGVPELFKALQHIWMNRPEDAHSTPKSKWAFKFDEALLRGIKEFGAQTDLVQNLPEFDIDNLPEGVNTAMLIGEPGDKYHFSKVLNHLADLKIDRDTQASIMWNAPTTKDLARDWSLSFVYERVSKAEKAPEPTRENPALEIVQERPTGYVELLTQEEREYVAKRPTFVDKYTEVAKRSGIDNEVYLHDGGWSLASMAFAFKGFIPQGKNKKMGLNLWNISFGESGSGKTSELEFYEACLDVLFKEDNEDKSPYHTGGDNSPQGLHVHLLERDMKPTLMIQDEAGIFFKAILSKSWMDELTHASADWYNGKVRSSSKLKLQELKGKTALSSFHWRMMGTPDQVFPFISDDMFESGFLARVLWSVAPELTEEQEDMRYWKRQYTGAPDDDFNTISPEVKELVIDLVTAARLVGEKPRPILAGDEELHRMYLAHKKMGETVKGHFKQNILDPSVTRLGEDYIRKCAAICAMYRGDTVIRMDDTLNAIQAVEKWFNYLLEVVEAIQQGEFQKLCNDMETFILSSRRASETSVLATFTNRVKRDPRELTTALHHLVQTGRVNKIEVANRVDQYEINGGIK